MPIDKKRIAAVVALEACCDRLTAVTGQLSGWGGACHVRIDHSSQPRMDPVCNGQRSATSHLRGF